MAILALTDLGKILRTPLADRAVDLCQGPRIYKLKRLGARWEALVLSNYQPETVSLRPETTKIDFRCTCGDPDPCLHALTLLLRLARDGEVPSTVHDLIYKNRNSREKQNDKTTDKTNEKTKDKNPEKSNFRLDKQAVKKGLGLELDLFDEGELQPSLFGNETPTPQQTKIEPTQVPKLPQVKVLTQNPDIQEFTASDRHRHAWEFSPPVRTPSPATIIPTAPPRFQLQFSESLGKTDIRLLARYNEWDIPSSEIDEYWQLPGRDGVIKRDLACEADFRRRFTSFLSGQLAWERGIYASALGLTSADWGLTSSLSDFLLTNGDELLREGFDILVLGRKLLGRASLSVNMRNDMDWFGVQASVKLDDASPTISLHLAPDTPASLVETEQGFVTLAPADLRRLAYLRSCGLDADGALRTSSVNLSLVETLYERIDNKEDGFVQSSHAAMQSIGKLLDEAYRSAHSEKHDLEPDFPVPQQPAGLNAQLRIYQLIGFAWLRELHSYGYGACLADDMGLGKTMQTLALLCSLKEEGRLGPSLIIAPVVTLGNWEAEILRFAPGLRFIRHQGQKRSRDILELRSYDLIIVSYQTLRNDLDLFAAHSWDSIILDEAHYIKNASSQVFKAVRVLTGNHRISLTGTPVENNSMELWAQFDFINPGLLGPAREFQERFANPLERKGDADAAMALRAIVRPFILRRKKGEVLSELPEKIETVHWVEMDQAQRELYEAHRIRYRDIILGLLEGDGLAENRMEVLRYILKLRQLAIAPVLADPSFAQYSSAKIDALMLMLEDLLAEDNKVLIFSQFTSTLDLIKAELETRNWKSSYLSGKTRDRQAEILRFTEESDRKVFLLSLKAGGVGINLTQANYVVLFDPWWNPASENQAVDRAYRMGQKRSVNAYRYICRDTIEEKILALQARKTILQEALVSPDAAALAHLDEAMVRQLFD